MTPARMAGIHAAAMPPARPWSEAEFAALIDGHARVITGSHSFALYRLVLDEAELLTIATDPTHRRRGQGRDVLHRALQAAAQDGARVMHLEVAADNATALALYGRAGFSRTGLRRAYYARDEQPAVDAVLMSCALPLGQG